MLLGREMKKRIYLLVGRDWFSPEPEMDIHYIGGTEVLPPPLDTDKEDEMLRELHGERGEWAKSILIEHNLRLVVYIAKRFDNTGVGVEDLISIGTIGLIKAINTFDVEKGTRLATYAARCVENEILMYFRAQKKNAQDVSVNEPIDTDSEGNPLTLMDIIATEDEIVEDIYKMTMLKKLRSEIKKITNPRERTIIILRYGLDSKKPLTQLEVAEKLNISRSYVSRIEKKVLTRLRKALEE